MEILRRDYLAEIDSNGFLANNINIFYIFVIWRDEKHQNWHTIYNGVDKMVLRCSSNHLNTFIEKYMCLHNFKVYEGKFAKNIIYLTTDNYIEFVNEITSTIKVECLGIAAEESNEVICIDSHERG